MVSGSEWEWWWLVWMCRKTQYSCGFADFAKLCQSLLQRFCNDFSWKKFFSPKGIVASGLQVNNYFCIYWRTLILFKISVRFFCCLNNDGKQFEKYHFRYFSNFFCLGGWIFAFFCPLGSERTNQFSDEHWKLNRHSSSTLLVSGETRSRDVGAPRPSLWERAIKLIQRKPDCFRWWRWQAQGIMILP